MKLLLNACLDLPCPICRGKYSDCGHFIGTDGDDRKGYFRAPTADELERFQREDDESEREPTHVVYKDGVFYGLNY